MLHGHRHDPKDRLDEVIQEMRARATARNRHLWGTPGGHGTLDAEAAHEVGEFLLELKVMRNEMARSTAMIRAIIGVRFTRGECADALCEALRREGFKVERKQELAKGGPLKDGAHAEFWVEIVAFSAT